MLSLGILGFHKQHPLQHQNAASMVASIKARVLLVYYMRYAASTVYIANLARVTELLAPARFWTIEADAIPRIHALKHVWNSVFMQFPKKDRGKFP